jgi:isocitrate dehydrogenase kinase/phosphatase
VAFHRDLLDAAWWQRVQNGITSGVPAEVLSYAAAARFRPPGHPAPG